VAGVLGGGTRAHTESCTHACTSPLTQPHLMSHAQRTQSQHAWASGPAMWVPDTSGLSLVFPEKQFSASVTPHLGMSYTPLLAVGLPFPIPDGS
jgi:hypothetical protein